MGAPSPYTSTQAMVQRNLERLRFAQSLSPRMMGQMGPEQSPHKTSSAPPGLSEDWAQLSNSKPRTFGWLRQQDARHRFKITPVAVGREATKEDPDQDLCKIAPVVAKQELVRRNSVRSLSYDPSQDRLDIATMTKTRV